MRSIDYYITESYKMSGGEHRTKSYPFVEDNVILVQKPEEDFNELKKRIEICKEKGVNIPAYIDYKFDGENYWILEELAPGKEFQSLVKNGNIEKIFAEMPAKHIEKYFKDVYTLGVNGIGIEPKRRNIFYDTEKGFTTIDVGLNKDFKEHTTLAETYRFFNMYFGVCLPPFSDNEYGEIVRKKTTINVMNAFEKSHPLFKKYQRWIYRSEDYFAEFLKNNGVNLMLDEDEKQMFIDLVNELIDNIVQQKIENPDCNSNYSYISFLSSSINYYTNFNLFDLNECTLEKYVYNVVNSKIKELFYENTNDNNLHELYLTIRRKELDPIHIYPMDYIYLLIEKEIKEINHNKK